MTDPIERSAAWLMDKLSGVGSDLTLSRAQQDQVRRCLAHYSAAQLFEGDVALPLYDACPAREDCWGPVPRSAYPEPVDATVSVPWIGVGYAAGGVAAVGINFNKYGGLGAQWWVRHAANKKLRNGSRETFSYRAGTYLALVHASRAHASLDVEPAPARVADAWDAAAFVEAVKCAPHTGVSKPTEGMWRNCPPRYLAREIALVAPSVIVAIGTRVTDVVAAALDLRWDDEPARGLRRGRGRIGDAEVELLGCNHPSYGHWRATVPALRESLLRRPLLPADCGT